MSRFLRNENGLQIDWQDPEYPIDVFPVDAFDKECSNEKGHQNMHYSKHDIRRADYIITVKGNRAELEYPKDLNDKDEVDPGKLTLIFKDDSRKVVEEFIWEDYTDGKTFKNQAITSWDFLNDAKSLLDYYKNKISELDNSRIYIVIYQEGLDEEEENFDVGGDDGYYLDWPEIPDDAYLIDIYYDIPTKEFKYEGLYKTPPVKRIQKFSKSDGTSVDCTMCKYIRHINGLIITEDDERLLKTKSEQLLNCKMGNQSIENDSVVANIIKLQDALPILNS